MSKESERPKAEHLHELVAGFSTAMLVTHTLDGMMRARPLSVAGAQDDGRVYFATSIQSPKVLELDTDARVVVTFQDSRRYVSLSGTAEITRDRALVDRLWSESWKVWFPAGKDDPTLVLIAVIPAEGEYWDQRGAAGMRYLFRAVKGYVTGTKPADGADPEQNAKVKL